MNETRMHRLSLSRLTRTCFCALGAALVLAGCSAAYTRRAADKEAYGIIQRTESKTLGHTNAFTVDTPYSSRKPQDISPEELIEDRRQTNRRVLTIEAAIELAVQSSREYQKAKEALFTTALRLSNTRYVVGRKVEPSSVTTASTTRESDGQVVSEVTTDTGLAISQLFKSGGRLTVDMLNSVMLYYSGRPELSFSRVSGSLIQPLWRGFGRNSLEVEALTQAERDMVYAVRIFSLYQDQFAVNTVNDYARLVAQKDNIRNRYTNYLGRVQSTKRLEARAKDRERLSDVDQARQAELTAKNNYVDAVTRYQNSLDDFKLTLGLPLGEKLFLDDAALDLVEQSGMVPAALDGDIAFRLALKRQVQVLNYIDQFEDSKRKARIAADQLKPRLTLTGGAALQSEPPADYANFDPDKVRAFAGLQLDLPLDQIPRRNAYRTAMVNFESELRTFTARLDDLKRKIAGGQRTLEQRQQNYEIQKNALLLADRRVASTTLMLEAGRVEVRELVDAQDAQINAQTLLIAAIVDYQQARLQLMLDIGALDTGLPQFWLKDHLATFLPAGTPMPTAPQAGEQAVLPPEDYLTN